MKFEMSGKAIAEALESAHNAKDKRKICEIYDAVKTLANIGAIDENAFIAVQKFERYLYNKEFKEEFGF